MSCNDRSKCSSKTRNRNSPTVIRSPAARIINNAGFAAAAGIPIDSCDSSKSKGRWKQRHIHESVAMDPGARVEQACRRSASLHFTQMPRIITA